MKRDEFDHAIRAACSILGVDELLVIGSQAIHGSVTADLPPETLRSIEVDVAVLHDPDGSLTDLVDGSIGEASLFHSTFGYYAKGVSASTAVLPTGWQDRLVRYSSPATDGVVALCLELHDLWVSKAVANRPKDREFCRALLQRELVDSSTLIRRLDDLHNVSDAVVAAAHRLVETSSGS